MVNRNPRRLRPSARKAGIHSGRFHAGNIRGGKAAVTLSDGDGTATVTLDKPMKDANYLVLTSSQTDTNNTDLCISVSTKSPQSFVINVTSTNQATGIVVGYLILDSMAAGATTHKNSRFGFHSGYAHFRNFQWGIATVTTEGSGHGTALTVPLPHPMKHVPMILASWDDDTAVTTGFIHLATGGATNKQFVIDCTGCSITNATVDITWVAFDPGFNVASVETVGQKAGNLAGQKLQSHGGIHSGDIHCKNLFGGVVAMTPSSGDIDEAVTFGQMLKNTPIVFAFKQSPVADTSGLAYVKSAAISGVTIGLEATVDDTESFVGYLVFDYEFREEATAEA